MLEIHGLPFSAHTRKTLIVARHKGLEVSLVPVVPIKDPPADWPQRSPLGKIPVLVDGDFTIPDSSVICAYLERLRPTPSIYPEAPRAYARALWIEEYIDGSLAQDVLAGVLVPLKIAPALFGRAPDHAAAERVITEVIPPKLDYLQRAIDGAFVVGDGLSVADVTLLSILVNYLYAGARLDRGRHPELLRWLGQILRHPSVRPQIAGEFGAVRDFGFDAEAVASLLG